MNIESFANNPYLSIGSLALAVIGIILAIVFFFRAQKNKIPCFDTSSNTIIEGLNKALEGLEIQYKGVSQERITITKVAFWNDGRETIDNKDLVQKDPLRLNCPKNIEILDIQVISDNSELNSIVVGSVVTKNDMVFYPLTFDYLDNDEYFIIQIIHNGSASEIFSIEGKIKGVRNITKGLDTKAAVRLFEFIPFMKPFGKVMFTPQFFKYFGSLIYFSGAMFAVWNLFIGNTQWYVWLAIPLLLFFSGVMYFGFKHISPVKI